MAVKTASAPTVNDDTDLGYTVGQIWIDTSTSPDTVYVLQDATDGAAVWTDVLTTDSREAGARRTFRFNASSTSLALSGMNTNLNYLGGGSKAFVHDTDGSWVRQDTSTTDHNLATHRYSSSTIGIVTVGSAPETWWYIKTDSDLTNSTYGIGLADSAGGAPQGNTDTQTLAHAYLRYSTEAGDAGWVLDTGDGSTQEVSAKVADIAASTVYLIYIDQRVSGQVSASIRTGSTWSAVVTNSTNVPPDTSAIRPHASVSNRIGGAGSDRSIFAGYLIIESD